MTGVFKRIVFSLITLVLFVFFAEVMLRAFNFPSVRLHDKVNALKKCWEETDEYCGNYVFNNLGLRGAEAIGPKKDGVYRVVCVGDSWTFGLNVPEEKSYPVFLEKYLRECKFKENVEVINAGYPGWCVQDMHDFILKNMKLLSPDCLIFLGGMNAASDEEPGSPGDEDYLDFYSSPLLALLARSRLYSTLHYLFNSDEAYRLRGAIDAAGVRENSADRKKAEERKEVASLQNTLSLLKERGKEVVVLSYFFPKENAQASLYSHYQEEEIDERDLGLYCTLKDPGFVFINVWEAFKNIENCNDLFLDMYYVHPNEKGYEVLAEIVGRQLLGVDAGCYVKSKVK